MDIANYKTLKTASKVSLAKEKVIIKEEIKDGDKVIQPKEERDAIFIASKRYNVSTGEALTDSKEELNLSHLEGEKSKLELQKASIQKEIDGIAQLITDYKAL